MATLPAGSAWPPIEPLTIEELWARDVLGPELFGRWVERGWDAAGADADGR